MNNKGFTLIEIIVSISILGLIAVASFVGIRLVNNNIRINKLKQITDRALQASQVYIETNNEAYNQLYTQQNGVVVPLNVLVNEGLLSLKNTDLTMDDIKDEYVLTALSSSDGISECDNIDTKASWDDDKVIFICLNNYSSTSENTIVSNAKDTDEIFFRGENPNNYVTFELNSSWSDTDNNLFRIFSIYNNKTKIVYNKPLSDWNYDDAFNSTYETDDSKKKELYDAIVNKDYLSYEKYYNRYYCVGTESSSFGYHDYVCSLKINSGELDYIGTISSIDLMNTISNNSSWLNSNYIGGLTDFSAKVGLSVEFNNGVDYEKGTYTNFLPLLTLRDCINITLDSSCSNDYEVGSKECPYILENKC